MPYLRPFGHDILLGIYILSHGVSLLLTTWMKSFAHGVLLESTPSSAPAAHFHFYVSCTSNQPHLKQQAELRALGRLQESCWHLCRGLVNTQQRQECPCSSLRRLAGAALPRQAAPLTHGVVSVNEATGWRQAMNWVEQKFIILQANSKVCSFGRQSIKVLRAGRVQKWSWSQPWIKYVLLGP